MPPTCGRRGGGGGGLDPLHLAPGSYLTTGGDTPESQFMVLVKGACRECAEAGPTGATGSVSVVVNAAQGWRTVREVYRSGLWKVQGMETHPQLAELERGLHGLQGGKIQVLPTYWVPRHPQSEDIDSSWPWLCVTALRLTYFPSLGKEDFPGPGAPSKISLDPAP